MHVAEIGPSDWLRMGLALAVPVIVGVLMAQALAFVGRSSERDSGSDSGGTLAGAAKLPLILGGLVLGIYLASVFARGTDEELVQAIRWDLVDRVLNGLAILLAFAVAFRLFVAGITFTARRAGRDPADLLFIRKLVGAGMFALALVMAMNALGFNVGPVLASLGVAGIAVALALQDTLANYFSGVTIAADRTFKAGDYVKLEGGQEGFVEAIGWRSTRIRPYGESVVIVPNSKLTSTIVTNHYLPDQAVRVYVDLHVAYEANLQAVEELLITIAKEVSHATEGADPSFEPLVRYKEFADSNMKLTVILRAEDFDKSFLLKHEYLKAVHRKFAEVGVPVNYPVRQVIQVPPGEPPRRQVEERQGDVI